MPNKMEVFALRILEHADCWKEKTTQRILSTERNTKYKAYTVTLLQHLIIESEKLHGTVLKQFWDQVASCHLKLKENIIILSQQPASIDPSTVLFTGLDPHQIDFGPVLKMAAEYFTHLGIAFLNLWGPKSPTGTPYSVTDLMREETEALLKLTKTTEFGNRREDILKVLAFRRDGTLCTISGLTLNTSPEGEDLEPILSHIIPNAVRSKSNTLQCIAMFAGNATRDLVINHLDSIGNVLNLDMDTHAKFDKLNWGIEAKEDNGMTKYIYRRIPFVDKPGPGNIRMRDGDEIRFGLALREEESQLGKGPLPMLCNLHLAVARVMRMSGAAEVIMKLMEDADDSDMPHNYIASDDFCNILNAKLTLTGIPSWRATF